MPSPWRTELWICSKSMTMDENNSEKVNLARIVSSLRSVFPLSFRIAQPAPHPRIGKMRVGGGKSSRSDHTWMLTIEPTMVQNHIRCFHNGRGGTPIHVHCWLQSTGYGTCLCINIVGDILFGDLASTTYCGNNTLGRLPVDRHCFLQYPSSAIASRSTLCELSIDVHRSPQ